MRVLVTGAGRSGTNWVYETIRATHRFQTSEKVVEDRLFFNREYLPCGYALKLATENKGFSIKNLNSILHQILDLSIVFCIRHPYNLALSKVRRGALYKDGGDSKTTKTPETVQTAIQSIVHSFEIYQFLSDNYPERRFVIKLEDLILKLDDTLNYLCCFLGCMPTPEMRIAHTRNRNPYQHQRYKGTLDKSQVDIYKRWDTVYDGYFKNREADVKQIKTELKGIAYHYGYDT